jgi:uncharacterized membrane protein YeaQ/YmgE (transglycosylase-associated protein family)
MGFLGTLIMGLVVGLVARAVKPGNDRMGIVMTTVLGIIGAFLAGFIGHSLHWYAPDEPAGLVASVLGAILVLAIAHAALHGRTRRI